MAKRLSETEWKAKLSAAEYRVLRMKGTEVPNSGKYYKHTKNGLYHCKGCETPLFLSTHKFNSGSGWPAFYDSIPGAIKTKRDGYRSEILCSTCDGHLGHVFKDEGFENPTNMRHCVNSVALGFQKDNSITSETTERVSFFRRIFKRKNSVTSV